MKKVHRYMLKTIGINSLIAIKSGIVLHTGGASNLYKRISCKLEYNYKAEDIASDLMRELSMIKDHAQYQ